MKQCVCLLFNRNLVQKTRLTAGNDTIESALTTTAVASRRKFSEKNFLRTVHANLEIPTGANYHSFMKSARFVPRRVSFSHQETFTMPTVKFVKQKKAIDIPDGANLRAEAMKNGVELYSGIHRTIHCPGLGVCTTCQVRITKGAENVSSQSLWEKLNLFKNPIAFFARLGQEKEVRLACRTRVRGDIEVETQPAFNWHGEKFWG